MAVSLFDILELEIMQSARIVAGEKGLHIPVKRVNFSDCPIEDDEIDETLVSNGDLFINSLYIAKDDPSQLLNTFKYFIKSHSAGAIIIEEFLTSLPEEILTIANETSYPIIFVSNDVSYAELTQTIMELILMEQSDIIAEMKIDKLMDKSISTQEVQQFARHLNGAFSNYYHIYFLDLPNNSFSSTSEFKMYFRNIKGLEVYKFHNNFMFILNHGTENDVTSIQNDIRKVLDNITTKYSVGSSNLFNTIKLFNKAIIQAFTALEIASLEFNGFMQYQDINVYKLLYPLKDTDVLSDFHFEVLGVLEAYDSNNNAELLTTLQAFLNNDADYKKAGKELHQHENTIRYRINKAKSILGLENDTVKFIELLSLGFRIKNLLKK